MGRDKSNDKIINNKPMTGGAPLMVERVQSSPRWPDSLVVQVAGRWYLLPVREGYRQPEDVSELVEQPAYVPDVMGDEVGERWWRFWGLARADVAEAARVC